MTDTIVNQNLKETGGKKSLKAQILERIRENLEIPKDIPRGGPDLQFFLKKIGAKLLNKALAMESVQELYGKYFKGKFTTQKLYRWARSNGSIHKRCTIQSDEDWERAQKLFQQGYSKQSLEMELPALLHQHDEGFQKDKVSKSTIMRLGRELKRYDFQYGYKKIKSDATQKQIGSEEEQPLPLGKELYQEASNDLSKSTALESWPTQIDFIEKANQNSVQALESLPECMNSIDFMHHMVSSKEEV